MTTAILLERLDQAILDVIDNPEKTQNHRYRNVILTNALKGYSIYYR